MDLGRMITLEEVLRAIGKNDYVVDCGGQFWDVTSGGEQAYIEGLPVRWYLGKPLSEQSQEFKEWLYSVLE